MEKRYESCPLCESAELSDPISVADRHYGIPGTFTSVRCLSCGLAFINPMPSSADLLTMYPKDYYAFQGHSLPSPLKNLIKRLLGLRTGTKDPDFSKPGRVLDFGCGSGWWLQNFKEKGWVVQGVEVNAQAAEIGKTAGIEIFCGTLEQAGFPPGHFDYVRSNHSFEHLTDPHETLEEMRRILKDDGKLLIGVPNIDGLAARIFDVYWWYFGAPVHPFNYSVATLRKMLETHGFRIIQVTYSSDFSGLLGSLQIWMNRKSGKKSHEGRLFNNRMLQVLSHWTAKMLDALSLGDAIEIIAAKCEQCP